MLRVALNAMLLALGYSSSAASVSSSTSDHCSDTSNLEPRADFMKRAARWTDEQRQNAGLPQGTLHWKRRERQWAAKLVEEGVNKWSTRASLWQPLI